MRWQLHKTIYKPINIALSNPSFELFLYLHFAEMPLEPVEDSDVMESMLRQRLGSYSKTHLGETLYASHVGAAISRGRNVTYDTDRYPTNPGTDVHKLVSSIMAMKPKKE